MTGFNFPAVIVLSDGTTVSLITFCYGFWNSKNEYHILFNFPYSGIELPEQMGHEFIRKLAELNDRN